MPRFLSARELRGALDEARARDRRRPTNVRALILNHRQGQTAIFETGVVRVGSDLCKAAPGRRPDLRSSFQELETEAPSEHSPQSSATEVTFREVGGQTECDFRLVVELFRRPDARGRGAYRIKCAREDLDRLARAGDIEIAKTPSSGCGPQLWFAVVARAA